MKKGGHIIETAQLHNVILTLFCMSERHANPTP